MTTDRTRLADRIGAMLTTQPSSREVKMFGGVSFMVNERIVVSVLGDGDLLVRAEPERTRELVALGARPAEMGAGRPMGPGWIRVDEEAIATADGLSFWIGVALKYNNRAGGVPQ